MSKLRLIHCIYYYLMENPSLRDDSLWLELAESRINHGNFLSTHNTERFEMITYWTLTQR